MSLVSEERPRPLVQKAERAKRISPGHHDWGKCSVILDKCHLCFLT
jgi:hypothetical protein